MRKEKIVEMDGRSVTVNELKTSDVINMLETDEGMRLIVGLSLDLTSDVKKLMKLTVDLPEKELDDLTEGINNFTLLENACREVNADFFASLPSRIEALTKTAQGAAKSIGVSLSALAGLSGKAT